MELIEYGYSPPKKTRDEQIESLKKQQESIMAEIVDIKNNHAIFSRFMDVATNQYVQAIHAENDEIKAKYLKGVLDGMTTAFQQWTAIINNQF